MSGRTLDETSLRIVVEIRVDLANVEVVREKLADVDEHAWVKIQSIEGPGADAGGKSDG